VAARLPRWVVSLPNVQESKGAPGGIDTATTEAVRFSASMRRLVVALLVFLVVLFLVWVLLLYFLGD
jgi:hypothetical protein